MSARCYVCGATDRLSEVHPHNWLCERCLPASEHIVAMSTGVGVSIAHCRCNWHSETAWAHRATVQDAKVRLHWRDVIRRKLAEVDAVLGAGTVAGEVGATFQSLAVLSWIPVVAVLLVEGLRR